MDVMEDFAREYDKQIFGEYANAGYVFDDGDIVGFSTDPRMVRLWNNRLDDRFYAIEPDGIAFDLETDTPEGWAYTNYDPMGPVGICTIAISKLNSVGDRDGVRGAVRDRLEAGRRFE